MDTNYLKYKSNFEKDNLYQILLNILSIVAVVLVIFAPIFSVTVGLGDFKATSNYSTFNEFMLSVKCLSSGSSEETLIALEFIIFPAVAIIMGIIILIISIKQLIETASNRTEDSYMLSYNLIKKSGTEQEKKSFFKQQTIYSLVLSVIFEVFFAKLFGRLFREGGIPMTLSYLAYVNGISFWAFILAFVFIGYIVIHVIKSKNLKNLKIAILKEEETSEVTKEVPNA